MNVRVYDINMYLYVIYTYTHIVYACIYDVSMFRLWTLIKANEVSKRLAVLLLTFSPFDNL